MFYSGQTLSLDELRSEIASVQLQEKVLENWEKPLPETLVAFEKLSAVQLLHAHHLSERLRAALGVPDNTDKLPTEFEIYCWKAHMSELRLYFYAWGLMIRRPL